MVYTKEQLKIAKDKLSPKVQDFVMDNETTELIAKHLKDAGLSEEHAIEADSEIFYAMLGLQSLYDAIGNISKLSGKPTKDLMGLKANLEKNIFSKIEKELNLIEKQIEENEKQNYKQTNVGTEFEQIILNQAKAMQPARPADETDRVTRYEVRGTNEDRDKSNETRDARIHDYKPGADPYREPPV